MLPLSDILRVSACGIPAAAPELTELPAALLKELPALRTSSRIRLHRRRFQFLPQHLEHLLIHTAVRKRTVRSVC